MTEPHKIYRSGCQEESLYADTTFSRHFTYKMSNITKGRKIRSLIKILLYILGFLLIAFTFTVIGMLIYSKLIGHCKKKISSNQLQRSNEINENYIPSLGEILSGMGMCRESYNYTNGHKSTPFQQIPINETDTVGGIPNLQLNVCDCTNALKLDNHALNGKDTEKYYVIVKEGNQCNCSEIIGNITEFSNAAPSKEENGSNPVAIGKCHCNNRTLNESEFDKEILNIEDTKRNQCICPETLEMTTFDDNEMKNGRDKNLTESLNTADVQDIPNFHFNETEFVNESRIQPMESFNSGETSDKINLNFNVAETLNENQSLMKEKCTCPKTRNMTYILFNGTKLSHEMHDLQFEEDVVCECPELNENVNFHKSTPKTETNENASLNTEECVCSEITETVTGESAIENNKRGFKTANGECACPEILGMHTFNVAEITNGSQKYDTRLFNSTEAFQAISLPDNEAESVNENRSLKSNKCVCPKPHEISDILSNETNDGFHDLEFSSDGGCVCPSTEVEEINNFNLQETELKNDNNDNESLKIQECVCHEKPQSLGNASRIESNKLGFKTVNGDCMCPETLDVSNINGNETETINKKEFRHDDDSMSVQELTNGHYTESVHGAGSNFGDDIRTVNVKGLRNSNERDNENKKEFNHDDEKYSSDTPLNFKGVTSIYDKLIAYEKELKTDDEK